jgi:hypothetical protein
MDIRSEAVYAQRINPSGAVQWTVNGAPVGSPVGSTVFAQPRMLADGNGGAIIAWPRYVVSQQDIYAQRINASGVPQWLPAEVPVCANFADQRLSSIASDGAGGGIIAWEDNRGGVGYDIYAQRVAASGALSWTPDGVVVCAADVNQQAPIAVSDGTGGAIVAWTDSRPFFESDVYAQRVRSDGGTATDVRGTPQAAFAVLPIWPNPFTGTAHIDLQLTEASDVSIEVFDVRGQRVRQLALANAPTSPQQVIMDGRDDAGHPLPSGIYFCRITAQGTQVIQKMVLMK